MRYKDKPKKRKLKASDEIRQRYSAKPIIALYQDEADAIIDNVLEESMIEGFYEWLSEWKKFIFDEANFVVKPRGKGESMYLAYTIQMGRMKVTAFSEDSDDLTIFLAYPDLLDIQDMAGFVENFADHGNPMGKVTLSTARADLERINNQIVREGNIWEEKARGLESDLDKLKADMEAMKPKFDLIDRRGPSNATLEDKVFVKHYFDLQSQGKLKMTEYETGADITMKLMDHFRVQTLDCGKRRTALLVLCALYYFQIRIPKTYLDGNEAHTEGYRKHNDLYNPLKRLHPPAIVRPRNGTRSWFEQQRMKHTESWHVKGHSRVLRAERYKEKRGQTIWINPFVKGSGEGMRLSIYADQIAGKDVVEVEEIESV